MVYNQALNIKLDIINNNGSNQLFIKFKVKLCCLLIFFMTINYKV